MVDIRLFYKEHPDPNVAGDDPSLTDPEAGEAVKGEAVAAEGSPQDGEANSRDVGVSPQDLQAASSHAANP